MARKSTSEHRKTKSNKSANGSDKIYTLVSRQLNF